MESAKIFPSQNKWSLIVPALYDSKLSPLTKYN